MPELPEVETTKNGLDPHLRGKRIKTVIVRQSRLRWPIPQNLPSILANRKVIGLSRRAKYLLFSFEHGTLILHLGMSGSLRLMPAASLADKHDHFELVLFNGQTLRLRDPRRFGAVLWTKEDPLEHPLLQDLGPEPFDAKISADFFRYHAMGRRVAIKPFIMNHHIIVGIGNIYANEALFRAGIHPNRQAGKISEKRYAELSICIQQVLREAIAQGGTSLRDFSNQDGKPGYFQQTLDVYQRTGMPCKRCSTAIRTKRIGQRASFYCPRCQR